MADHLWFHNSTYSIQIPLFLLHFTAKVISRHFSKKANKFSPSSVQCTPIYSKSQHPSIICSHRITGICWSLSQFSLGRKAGSHPGQDARFITGAQFKPISTKSPDPKFIDCQFMKKQPMLITLHSGVNYCCVVTDSFTIVCIAQEFSRSTLQQKQIK